METYALLGNGSDITLCDERLREQLGIEGIQISFFLTTQEKKNSVKNGLEVKLVVETLDGSQEVELHKVWTVDQLNVSSRSIATQEDIEKCPHLRDVELPNIDEKEVRLLIGSDISEAFWVLDERRGMRGEPYAIQPPLGWTIVGPPSKVEDKEACFRVNFVRLERHEKREKDLLLQQVEIFWETDFGGSISNTKTYMSVEDKKALKVMASTVEMVNGQYQVALPWRQEVPHLTNNRLMAERRLHSLKRRLLKDRDLHQ